MSGSISMLARAQQLRAEQHAILAEIQRLRIRHGHITRELSTLPLINSLPPELLAEVFMIVVAGLNLDRAGALIWYVLQVPCQVCSYWRAVARCTPALWSLLDLDYIKGMDDPVLRLQLELSGMAPLKIVSRGHKARNVRAVLSGLSNVDAARVADIQVEGDGITLRDVPARALPALSSVEVIICRIYDGRALDFLAHAPAVTRLWLTTQYLCSDRQVERNTSIPDLKVLSFANLTHLSIFIHNGLPISTLFPAISRFAPSLYDFQMTANCPLMWPEKAATTIYDFPALHHLILDMYTHKLLTHITAPALEEVIIGGLEFASGDPMASLLNLLERSKELPIREFKLMEPVDTSLDTILRCLKRMPHVRRLCLEQAPYMLELMEALVCVKDKPPLLPELDSVFMQFLPDAMDGMPAGPTVEAAIKRLLRSRNEPRVCAGRAVAALRELTTDVC
ncbi:hypothetical protein K523DRAFT_302727 [Schizophyllum commune Tattone D]|nr:hypothetical protein K523DRAFT_302727 [Schizophyllum commune Tattone D]